MGDVRIDYHVVPRVVPVDETLPTHKREDGLRVHTRYE